MPRKIYTFLNHSLWTQVPLVRPPAPPVCRMRHWNRFKLSSKLFYWASKAVLLLWIIYVIYVLCSSCFRVCALLPCGHLLGKGWPLGSCLWCLIVFLSFPIWYPGSGVLLYCIDSWSLPPFLLKAMAVSSETFKPEPLPIEHFGAPGHKTTKS